jgi:hypothetical protein
VGIESQRTSHNCSNGSRNGSSVANDYCTDRRGTQRPHDRVDGIPRIVDIRDLVRHELDCEEDPGDDHEVGSPKYLGNISPAEPMRKPKKERHEIQVDA